MSSAFAASANTKQIAASIAPPLNIFFMCSSYRQSPQFEAPSIRQNLRPVFLHFRCHSQRSAHPTPLCILENSKYIRGLPMHAFLSSGGCANPFRYLLFGFFYGYLFYEMVYYLCTITSDPLLLGYYPEAICLDSWFLTGRQGYSNPSQSQSSGSCAIHF